MSKYNKKQKEQMIILRENGFSLKEIAEKLDIKNIATISKVCHEAGLEKKPYSIRAEYSIGQRFNNFIIIGQIFEKKTKSNNPVTCWECKCDCGTNFTITTKQIHRGQKSCGCLSVKSRFHMHDSKQVIGNHKYGLYKYKANERKLSFELTKEQFIELLFSNCNYCNTDPSTLIKLNKHVLMVNGVDRVNNDLGYITSNCVACCKFCNRAKSDATIQEFTDWILKVKNKGSI